jgi:hypothetical protein
MSRPVGSSRICCTSKFAVSSVVSTTAGAAAVTVMSSETLATLRDASARAVCARLTVTRCVTCWKPSRSNDTVYSPGGSAAKT